MEQTTMKPGDLVKFTFVYDGCDLNRKTALYLGENFIHRDDGLTIENHKILVVGKTTPTIIDRGLLKHMYNVVHE